MILTATVLLAAYAPGVYGDEQTANPMIRLSYRLLRHRGNWSGLAGWDRLEIGDVFDPIKYVPLSDEGGDLGKLWRSLE